jgi:hypothetical protein
VDDAEHDLALPEDARVGLDRAVRGSRTKYVSLGAVTE